MNEGYKTEAVRKTIERKEKGGENLD
ncbi:uncharacterized protein G2W53_029561 [Senna tora]|uniref:Uncharacterized protein n=1 Tax=Senna tora TaxID=362788 RepID=A0A834T5E3_9FABA|nr:uncharacterized protein G2W53_029561 [Senna tora]